MFSVFFFIKKGNFIQPRKSYEINTPQIYGLSLICGVGFTMSLFVNSLAFSDPLQFMFADKLAILVGSGISGVIGYLILRAAATNK